MGEIKRAYADSRFGQLHYRVVTPDKPTAAPPLLCLHQTPNQCGEWLPIMPALGLKRTVIAVDTPGYGMSDPPPAPASIEDFAEIMNVFMTDLAAQGIIQAGPFDAMGYHTGSIIATQLARTLPGRLRRAVMFGLAAYPAEIRAKKRDMLPVVFPPPGDNLDHIEKLWRLVGHLHDPRIGMEKIHVNMAESLRLGSRMIWGFDAVYRFDFLGAMQEVAQPVLIFNAEDDLWTVTRQTSQHFCNGKRYDLPGVKHGLLELETKRLVSEIEAFLDM